MGSKCKGPAVSLSPMASFVTKNAILLNELQIDLCSHVVSGTSRCSICPGSVHREKKVPFSQQRAEEIP
jgi:hypothetical protein